MHGRPLRIALGGIWHESNTFAAGTTTLEAFHAYQFAHGNDLLERYRDTNTEAGGMIAAAEKTGVTLVPTVYAGAVPGPVIEQRAFEYLLEQLVAAFRQALPLDGALLCLHGAAVADQYPDADAAIAGRLREVIGAETPLAATFDLHANLSHALVDAADVLVGYDTFPHVDMSDRGYEATMLLVDMCRTGHRLAGAHCKLPLLTAPQTQATGEEPLKSVFEHLHRLETEGRIVCGSIAPGFPYADVPSLGASVITYAHSQGAADQASAEIASILWSRREKFTPDLVAVDKAVEQAVASPHKPVVLVDPADNVGGGSPGDGTQVLAALLNAGAHGAVAVLYDPEAARSAAAVGIGNEFRGPVGGKSDHLHGAPVLLEGEVVYARETSYRHSGSYMSGIVTDMGLTAVIECGGSLVVLTSLRTMPFDIEQLRCLGIDPAEQEVIVVKSALAWRAAYEPIAGTIIHADTEGVCSSNLRRFRYNQPTDPLYPLQEPGGFTCQSITRSEEYEA